MLDGPIVDVVIGLVFFYVALSLVVSTLQEWIASICGWRSANLYKGIEAMLGKTCAKKVYSHALIKSLAKKGKQPSYISAETFRSVLESVTQEKNETKEEGKTKEEKEEKEDLASLLEALGVSTKSGGYQDQIEKWFDEGMTRIAGWYKRKTKVFVVLIAVAVTLATNADTFRMAEELWVNDALRTQIVDQALVTSESDGLANASSDDMTRALGTLPIGWKEVHLPRGNERFLGWLHMLMGWGITVAAISLGAPFWFDVLGRVANIRGSGKSKDEVKNPSR